MKTTFDEGLCPTPGNPDGNHAGQSGGADIMDGHGGKGLVSSPYDDGICPPPGGKETRSSELGLTPYLTDVKDAPSGQPTGQSSIGMLNDHTTDQTFKPGK